LTPLALCAQKDSSLTPLTTLPVRTLPSMADIDPPVDDIFAGMKKKKKGSKKAAVNLDELDVDAPAAAAPSNDATSVSGSGAAANLAAAPTPADADSDGELDFSSIKKKKKKSVRIDSDVEDAADLEDSKPKSKKRVDNLGNEVDDEQPTEEVTAVDASGMDEFADLKKKRKKSSKKAFDLDAFEKELAEAEATQDEPKSILKKPTPAGSDDEGAEENDDEEDEPVEGEDPFGKDDHDDSRASKAEAAANAKAWLTEDRDYTYTEVSRHGQLPSCSPCF
jgi:translation initiation factor 2 subunit 2